MRAIGSYTIDASIDTGPFMGTVKQTLEINIDPMMEERR